MNKIITKIGISIIISIFIASSLMACSRTFNKKAETYQIYYANAEGTRLTTIAYNSDNKDKEVLLKELIEEMDGLHKSNETVVIKPKDVKIENIQVKGDKAIISFNNKYKDMNSLTEVLYRTAFVKTITQIEGIESIDFYSQGKVIVNNSGIKLEGMTNAEYVADNGLLDVTSEWIKVSLYFANEKGDKLVKSQVNVAYNNDVSLASIIVKRIIAGPSDNALYDTLSPQTGLLGVTTRNGICYVNFDDSFLNNLVNVSGELPIYSIVNSLCELKSITGVKILINGNSKDIKYRQSISLDTVFKYNASYVEGGRNI